jgi:acetylornithine deacetylase/succinyl-diaminopimelate desuccinylase-like protein
MKNQPNAVGAIGHIDVYPNSRNIIPGKVVFTVDLRTHLLDKLNGMVASSWGAEALRGDRGELRAARSSASSTRPPSTRAA